MASDYTLYHYSTEKYSAEITRVPNGILLLELYDFTGSTLFEWKHSTEFELICHITDWLMTPEKDLDGNLDDIREILEELVAQIAFINALPNNNEIT